MANGSHCACRCHIPQLGTFFTLLAAVVVNFTVPRWRSFGTRRDRCVPQLGNFHSSYKFIEMGVYIFGEMFQLIQKIKDMSPTSCSSPSTVVFPTRVPGNIIDRGVASNSTPRQYKAAPWGSPGRGRTAWWGGSPEKALYVRPPTSGMAALSQGSPDGGVSLSDGIFHGPVPPPCFEQNND
ncbi:hypothetical protein TWF481_008802 [Arthrobotrys musiformis]|uniref:Uncharacterized protein n=1 Tax=Arthrobotrys musiformis TaxID=47236 RepID=A0AAV9W9R5_9PEZI